MLGFFKRKQRFTLDYLRFVYQTLEKHPIITPRNESSIIKTLKDVAEHMIYGDQHNKHLVLFLAEKNFLAFFLKLLRQNYSRDITVQLLQTLSIMVQNIEKQYGLYYLFSQNHINDIIVYDFDFNQPEVLNYYITFLKTISMKLNRDVIHFFFNSQAEDFPLYTEALKLYKHRETLVRTTVRALTLNVYKVEDKELRQFILKRSAVTYLTQAVWLMREQCVDMHKHVNMAEGKDKQTVISDGVEHQKDHYFYLEDMLKLGFPELHAIVSDQLLSHFLLPVLLGSVWISDRDVSDDRNLISCKLALFLLTQVCEIFRDPDLLNPLIVCLLHPHPPRLATELTLNPVEVPVMAKPTVSEVLWSKNKPSEVNQELVEELSSEDKPMPSVAAAVNIKVPPLPKSHPPEPPKTSLIAVQNSIIVKPNNPSEYKPYPIAPYIEHTRPSGSTSAEEPFLTLDEQLQKTSISVTPRGSEHNLEPVPSTSSHVDIEIEKEITPPRYETVAVLRPQGFPIDCQTNVTELHERLLEMGYSDLTCKRALSATNYAGLSEAVQWLLSHPDMITQVDQNVLNPRSKLNKHVKTCQPVKKESFDPLPDNPVRDKIMGFLCSDDEQLISCAASLLLTIIRNPDASKLLMKDIGLEPQKRKQLFVESSQVECAEKTDDENTIDQNSYQKYSIVVDICFKSLGRLNNLSIFTIRVLCELITDLALTELDQSTSVDEEILAANKTIANGLSEEHNKSLLEIYDRAMTNLRGCLPLPTKLEGFFLDTFFEEWRAFKNESNIKKLVEKPIRILPTSIFSNRSGSVLSQENRQNRASMLAKIRKDKLSVRTRSKETPGGSTRGHSPAPPPPSNPPPVSELTRLRKIIDRLRKTIQVLLHIGRLRERFTGLTQTLPFQLQRDWRYYISQRISIKVLLDSVPVVVLQGSKKKKAMMSSRGDPDYIVLWTLSSKNSSGNRGSNQRDEAVVQFTFPVAHAEALQHHTDWRVVHLIMQHHRKPMESCVEVPKQRNKWMLTLYFNTKQSEPIRTSDEAERNAKQFISFVMDNRNRKRAEMQRSIANLLGGEQRTTTASWSTTEKLSLDESKEAPLEVSSKSCKLQEISGDNCNTAVDVPSTETNSASNSALDCTQTSVGNDTQLSERERLALLQPSPKPPAVSSPAVAKKHEASEVSQVTDQEYWKQEEVTIAGLLAPTYSKKKFYAKGSDAVPQDRKVSDI